TLSVGYGFEGLWFSHDTNGTFIGNEVNTSIKHKITKRIYQKVTYRFLGRDYTGRKARLANGNKGSKLRVDTRNLVEHELGFFPTDITKLRMTNQVYFNDSNDEYYDYYDYLNYRLGFSIIQYFNPKFYTITGFYYQLRNYDSRLCSDKYVVQKDKQYTVTTSLMYDLTKNISAFVNYSYTENQSNEPLERCTDKLYTAGVYYMF
ncbi:MAG: outer membrane beta-barrel protein, partial [Candidatus Omnitrophica bacterium]|nr:outer membrane beta-barrel protein [Candidatus Omnitrophota bacterium]